MILNEPIYCWKCKKEIKEWVIKKDSIKGEERYTCPHCGETNHFYQLRRNNLCLCGSGKKWKNCCKNKTL